MKLNAGSGGNVVEGWVGLDIRPTKGVDICADIRYLPFADNSFDEVHCHHTLEHLHRRDARKAAGEFWRVLKPGKRIVITVPDTPTLCTWYLLHPEKKMQALNGLYGPLSPEGAGHKWGYDRGTLKMLMESVGFKTVVIGTTEKLRPTPTLLYIGGKDAD